MGHELILAYHLEEEYLLAHDIEWVIDHYALVHRSQFQADLRQISSVEAGVIRAHAPKGKRRPLPSYEEAMGGVGDIEWKAGVWWIKEVADQDGER